MASNRTRITYSSTGNYSGTPSLSGEILVDHTVGRLACDDGTGGWVLTATKNEVTALTQALNNKADQTTMTSALANKADALATTIALNGKVDLSSFHDALAAKADISLIPTIQIGSVTVGSPGQAPSVTNGGTATNIILNFVLPLPAGYLTDG